MVSGACDETKGNFLLERYLADLRSSRKSILLQERNTVDLDQSQFGYNVEAPYDDSLSFIRTNLNEVRTNETTYRKKSKRYKKEMKEQRKFSDDDLTGKAKRLSNWDVAPVTLGLSDVEKNVGNLMAVMNFGESSSRSLQYGTTSSSIKEESCYLSSNLDTLGIDSKNVSSSAEAVFDETFHRMNGGIATEINQNSYKEMIHDFPEPSDHKFALGKNSKNYSNVFLSSPSRLSGADKDVTSLRTSSRTLSHSQSSGQASTREKLHYLTSLNYDGYPNPSSVEINFDKILKKNETSLQNNPDILDEESFEKKISKTSNQGILEVLPTVYNATDFNPEEKEKS